MLTELQLKHMVRDLPTTDVKQLLDFANRNSIGQDRELIARALDLLKLRHPVVEKKIEELHRRRFPARYANVVRPSPTPSTTEAATKARTTTTAASTPAVSTTNTTTVPITPICMPSAPISVPSVPVPDPPVSAPPVPVPAPSVPVPAPPVSGPPVLVPAPPVSIPAARISVLAPPVLVPSLPISAPTAPICAPVIIRPAICNHGPPAPNRNERRCSPSPKRKSASEYKRNHGLTFKDLPFYDVLSSLLEPRMLVAHVRREVQENEFRFDLTTTQIREILSSRVMDAYGVQVQLRFCVFDVKTQNDDQYPQKVHVRVNGQNAKVPIEAPPKQNVPEHQRRPSQPIDITHLCDLSANEFRASAANRLLVSWITDRVKFHNYTVGVFLVRRLNPTILLTRLQSKGVRDPTVSRAIIAEKLRLSEESSDVVAVTGLMESLQCPIGMTRMHVPCRAETCSHVKCFDAMTYLKMNEANPRWMCPACGQPAIFGSLAIDGLFVEILDEAPEDCSQVILQANGTWTCIVDETEVRDDSSGSSAGTNPHESTTVYIIDDEEDVN